MEVNNPILEHTSPNNNLMHSSLFRSKGADKISKFTSLARRLGTILLILVCYSSFVEAITYYTRVPAGNWSSTTTWSTVAGGGAAAASIPGAGDDIEICNGHVITVDVTYS